MREIKFRGRRVDNGEWVYGSLINNAFVRSATNETIPYIFDENLNKDYDSFEDIANILDAFGEVIPETVGQFIGHHDDNHKEIYDGDWVKHTIVDEDSCMDRTDTETYLIQWNDQKCIWELDDGKYHCLGDNSGVRDITWVTGGYVRLEGVEVIGNKFDNPELEEGNDAGDTA
jgi:uncharacterized phage protein (TIGR01671 family)